MKSYIITGLFLFLYLVCFPSFAQQCEEGDVYLIEDNNTVFLKECRSGTLSDLLSEDFENFFEANRGDSTFTSALATVLNSCEHCSSATQNDQTVVLSVPLSIANIEIIHLHYISDKYKQWLLENNRETNSNSVKCYPEKLTRKEQDLINRGQRGCRLFQCEGIEGTIALEPFNMIARANVQFIHSNELIIRLSLSRVVDRPIGGGLLLQWVLVPESIAYNKYGSCNGPFDSVIRSQNPTP